MRVIEEPSTIRLPLALDDAYGIPNAHVRLNTSVPEVIERTEDVVVIAGRERELQERPIRDLAGREPSDESALERVLLASCRGSATSSGRRSGATARPTLG